MKRLENVDAVGWGFFLIVFVVLSAPLGWMTWRVTAADVPAILRVGFGVVLAALVAAVIAWVVNDLLYRRNLRIHEVERKAERRMDRKKKKR